MKIEDMPEVQELVRNKILATLKQCTEGQVAKFRQIFPEWPDKMTPKSLANALDICERTVKKNRQQPERVQFHDHSGHPFDDVYENDPNYWEAAAFHDDCGDR